METTAIPRKDPNLVQIPLGMIINMESMSLFRRRLKAMVWINDNPFAKAMREKVRYHFAKRIMLQRRTASILSMPEDTGCPEQPA